MASNQPPSNRPPRQIDEFIRLRRNRDAPPSIRLSETFRRPKRLLGASTMLVLSFALLMSVGAGLLTLPISSVSGQSAPLQVAYFTAISSVTVTGHTVVSTPDYWTSFGHAVIFVLMLVGGLGFMVTSTFLLLVLGSRTTIQMRAVARDLMSDTSGAKQTQAIRTFGTRVIVVMFFIYTAGALIFLTQIHGLDGAGTGRSFWYSLFLSVSAFNNAGLNIIPEAVQGNAARFVSNPTILLTMALMIAMGGLGWVTFIDVWRQRRFARFSLDTKLVILTSVGIWFLGWGVLAFFEFLNPDTLGGLSWMDKVVNSAFLATSYRTAGFSSIDYAQVKDIVAMTYTTLMFIGGAPGSVAGGIKVVSFAIIVAAVVSSLKGRSHAEAFGREIPQPQLHRALAVAVLGVLFVFISVIILVELEPEIPFEHLLFDLVSAMGTVGSSTGIVPSLGLDSQSLLMVAMFVGRLGPLVLAMALTPREDEVEVYRYAQEHVRIG